MSLIDTTYFDNGFINVPNVDKDIQTEEGSYLELVSYIETFERDFFCYIFNYKFYDLILTSTESRFETLRNKFVDKTNLKSPIANYVWFKLWQASQRQSTASGDVALNGSLSGMNINKAILIWNDMCLNLSVISDWWNDNYKLYPEFDDNATFYETINSFGI